MQMKRTTKGIGLISEMAGFCIKGKDSIPGDGTIRLDHIFFLTSSPILVLQLSPLGGSGLHLEDVKVLDGNLALVMRVFRGQNK
jgi:hypothetical protein